MFAHGAVIAAPCASAGIVVIAALSLWRSREAKRVAAYGSARWAGTKAVRQAALLGDQGVVLNRRRSNYLPHDEPEHVLCIAPARSGEGVGLVVLTLLVWPGSAIVHDIKGEISELNAGWRARFRRPCASIRPVPRARPTTRCWSQGLRL